MWLDIAAVDVMLQGVGLHLMSYCAQFDLHKQIASGKSYPIEAAEDKTLVAVTVEVKMVQFLVTDVQTGD